MQEWAHDHCRLEQCVKAGNEAEAMSQKGLASAEIKGENGEFQKVLSVYTCLTLFLYWVYRKAYLCGNAIWLPPSE